MELQVTQNNTNGDEGKTEKQKNTQCATMDEMKQVLTKLQNDIYF